MRAAVVVAVGLVWVFAFGCSGKDGGEARAPAPVVDDSDDDNEPTETLIPPEEYDRVHLYFERKRNVITRCFTDAIEAGEIPSNAVKAFLSVTVTVVPGGKVTNINFTETAAGSALLERCARGHIESWVLPEVSQSFDYSHRYGFSKL
ncbi:hypothetical protein [Haliangium sp.]|uniref:hypothetical protein n=1 Tax=Haliangium sp. TaxID=2663208 RepID=UPI003D0F7050